MLSIERDGKKTTIKKIIRKVFYKAKAGKLFELGLAFKRHIKEYGLKKTINKTYKKYFKVHEI